MKKTKPMRTEYRREDLGSGVRGKHFGEFQKGSNLVVVSPELSKIFPTNEAVNAALSSLVAVARSAAGARTRPSGRGSKPRAA
jgi:hypothetical protein